MAIKRYLAAKLKDFKDQNQQLASALTKTKEHLGEKTDDSASAHAEVRTLREQQQRVIAEGEHRANSAVTEEREKSLELQRQLQERAEKERRELNATHDATNQELRMKLNSASEEVKSLTDEKYRLESSGSALRTKMLAVDEQNKELTAALHKTRAENRELDLHHHDSEKLLNSCKTKKSQSCIQIAQTVVNPIKPRVA